MLNNSQDITKLTETVQAILRGISASAKEELLSELIRQKISLGMSVIGLSKTIDRLVKESLKEATVGIADTQNLKRRVEGLVNESLSKYGSFDRLVVDRVNELFDDGDELDEEICGVIDEVVKSHIKSPEIIEFLSKQAVVAADNKIKDLVIDVELIID